jgi:hypothetical protein
VRKLTILGLLLCAGALATARLQGDGPTPDSQPTNAPAVATSTSVDEPPYITPACQKSIDRGMAWLLSAMDDDGAVGADIGQWPDLSCTAITGLALLAEGNTPQGGKHSRELTRLLDAVLTMVDRLPSGRREGYQITLVQRKIGANADRFFAALFLSEMLGEAGDDDEDIRNALNKLVIDVCAAQGKDGTWGDESWAPVLGTVMGWECLRSSASSGLKVEASAELAGKSLLEKLKGSINREESWMHDFYKNASSIRVLYSMGYRNDPVFDQCLKKTLRFAEWDDRPFTEAGGEEFLGFFLVTECLLQEQTGPGTTWYPTVRDKIMKVQNADGSWSGHHCITHRTFCTAAALLSLQAPNFYLSMSNQ